MRQKKTKTKTPPMRRARQARRRRLTVLILLSVAAMLGLITYGVYLKRTQPQPVVLVSNSNTPFADRFEQSLMQDEAFAVVRARDPDVAAAQLRAGRIAGYVLLPPTFGKPDDSGLPRGSLTLVRADTSFVTDPAVVESRLRTAINSLNAQVPAEEGALRLTVRRADVSAPFGRLTPALALAGAVLVAASTGLFFSRRQR